MKKITQTESIRKEVSQEGTNTVRYSNSMQRVSYASPLSDIDHGVRHHLLYYDPKTGRNYAIDG